jgi:O-antigen ligase
VELKWSLLELRAILSLLLIFPVVDGVRRLKDLEVGLVVFLVAVAVSAVVITREFLLGQGGVSTFSDDATRINNLVYLYPLAGIAWAVALVPFARNRATRVLVVILAGLSAAALYFTFRRGGWVVALLIPIGVMGLLPRHRRGGLVRKLLVLAGSIVVVIAVANSFSSKPIKSPLTSGRDRLFSLGETVDDVSTRHRLAEFKEARKLILGHPLTGIGLGATITFVSPLYDQEAESADVPQTNIYVHDSYEWVALKLGLPAFGVFLLLLGAVLRDAYRGYRRVHDPRSSRLMLGGFAMLVALVVLSLTEPHLTYVGSAPLFAAVIALTQLVPQLSDTESAEPASR